MTVTLRPELASFLNELVQSGQYPSAEEALNEAVQLLQKREGAGDALEALLREAEESGPAREVTPEDWAAIEREGLERLRSRKSA